MFLYIKYNESPVVKSSNLLLSAIQLTAQIILVIILPYTFIGEPNTLACFLRPVLVGLLLTVAIYVTLCKTRTLLRIFQSKIRISNREKAKTGATELLVLLIFSFSDISILLVSFN